MATGEKDKQEEAPPVAASKDAESEKKHPLQNRWSLWFLKADKTKEWKENLKLVISFDTVEDFWAVYNHIKPPAQITSGCDYMLFKEGIEPMWEDPKNRNGGRWLVNLEKKDRQKCLDNCWMETLMCLIGEGFDLSSDEVCGAVVQNRSKGDKIAIWTGDSTRNDDILHIGRTYKEKLQIYMHRPTLVYQVHRDVISKTGSVSKSKFTLNN